MEMAIVNDYLLAMQYMIDQVYEVEPNDQEE